LNLIAKGQENSRGDCICPSDDKSAVIDPTHREHMALAWTDAVILGGNYGDACARTFVARAL